MAPTILLFLVLIFGGMIATVVSAFSQISGLKTRLTILEGERERDRELLDAVLLEDTAKLRRLMGTRD